MSLNAKPSNPPRDFFGEAFFRSLSVGLRYAPASSEAAEKRYLPSESSFVPSPVQF
jgi:hypothetical protein